MHLFHHEYEKLPDDAEEMNLCYLGSDGYQAQGSHVYRKLAHNPQYLCKNCGRAAHEAKNLCQPEKIRIS